jgi:hypothetical protein
MRRQLPRYGTPDVDCKSDSGDRRRQHRSRRWHSAMAAARRWRTRLRSAEPAASRARHLALTGAFPRCGGRYTVVRPGVERGFRQSRQRRQVSRPGALRDCLCRQEPLAELLPAMLSAFLASDREFAKARRSGAAASPRSTSSYCPSRTPPSFRRCTPTRCARGSGQARY